MKNQIEFKRSAIILFASVMMVIFSCKKERVAIPDSPFKLEVPANFPKYVDDPDNPLTTEGVELGRLLFYDTRLSGNNKLSCASCHRQELAFSDGVALNDIGVSGTTLPRHAPALINLAWVNSGLFWDGGSTNLESQAFAPITNMDEMHQDLIELEHELRKVPAYVTQFKLAFNSEIKSALIAKALAQFQRTLISGNAKYDQAIRKENSINLTSKELEGLAIVNTKCRKCHSGELFTDNDYHNNGIDDDFSNAEHEGLFQGRYRVSFNPMDMGKFKTPTLRNVALTAPYMHDGRFTTLEQVLDHYSAGIKVSPTIDISLYPSNGVQGINLSKSEKSAVIAFLNTLTDKSFITNNKLSIP
jgi:cytochrome c peroxidase